MIPGVLCYVEGRAAYFTTAPLQEQWGDDWNDAPYEHNAGTPYGKDGVTISVVYFESNLQTPDCEHVNSPWSVEDINACKVAWLRGPDRMPVVWAGATFEEFRTAIEERGGTVFVPLTTTGGDT